MLELTQTKNDPNGSLLGGHWWARTTDLCRVRTAL